MTNDELSPDEIDAFVKAVTREHLFYLWFVRARGYAVDEDKIRKLELEVYPDLAAEDTGRLSQRDVDQLQVLLATVEPRPNNRESSPIRALLLRLGHTTLRIRKEHNHQRPHFHIEYKNQYKASYAIDNFERLAGEIPAMYEKPVLQWARQHQQRLKQVWDKLQAGESIPELTAQLYNI